MLKGDVVAASIKASVKDAIQDLCAKGGCPPRVAIVEAAEDSAAHVYIGQVERTFRQVGIESHRVTLRIGASTEELVAAIQRLANDDDVHGILLPTPLPRNMSLIAAQDAIPPDKDIDGIASANVGRLALRQPKTIPATPLGGMELIRHYGIPVDGRRAVVIGRSPVVGWPMATLLQQAGATVTICHTRTRDLPSVTREAEILVSAAGRAGLVTADMVRPGAVVIDFGVNMTERGMCGDVDFDSAKEVAGWITPVPGGVGPMTITMLVANTVQSAERISGLGK